MISSNNFRTAWWGILALTIGSYLFARYNELIKGNSSLFDVVVFLVWVGVCLAPIFNEMDIFGIKLKQKIDDLKKDVSNDLKLFKTEIKSAIEVSNANNNQIYLNTGTMPPDDAEIPWLTEKIQKTLRDLGVSPAAESTEEYEVEPTSIEMFKIRLSFEKVLREVLGTSGEYYSRYSIKRMMNMLSYEKIIPKEILNGVMEVISICNQSVHGEPITETQLKFVRESSPGLLNALRNGLKQFRGKFT